METPAFLVEVKTTPDPSLERRGKKKNGEEKKEQYWNAFNMLPNKREGFNESIVYEYQLKQLCFLAAKEDPKIQEWLYEEKSLLFVYEMLMMSNAINKAKNLELLNSN